MLFKRKDGLKQVFRKGNENWRMRKLFDQERPVITVAQDGSGDFQKLEDAIRIATELSGATILLKKGTYLISYNSVGENWIIPSNTKIEGDGFDSIIQLGSTPELVRLDLTDKSKIIFKELKIISSGFEIPIELSGTEYISFEKVMFKWVGGESSMMGATGIITSKYLKVLNCNEDISVSTGTLISGIDFSKSIFKGNDMQNTTFMAAGGGAYKILNSIINNNIFDSITFIAGSDYNICIGNQTDVAIVNSGTGNEVAHNVLF